MRFVSSDAFTKYFFFCSLSSQPIVHVNITVLEGGTTIYNRVSGTGDDDDGKRRLRTNSKSLDVGDNVSRSMKERLPFGFFKSSREQTYEYGDSVPGLRLTSEISNQDTQLGTWKIAELRECTCAPQAHFSKEKYYCPAERSYCAVPGAYHSTPSEPVCLSVHNDEIFVRSIWPIILIWFALTSVFCVCTWAGRNACDYMIAVFFPCWNTLLFDAICLNINPRRQPDDVDNDRSLLQRLVNSRRGYIQDRYRGIVRRARMSEDGISSDCFEYELRTRTFRLEEEPAENVDVAREAPTLDDGEAGDDSTMSDEQNTPSCAICFLPLEDGDRVGALECEHVFHVECLKGWLTRRNVCPLCLHEGIAKPKRRRSQLQRRTMGTNSSRIDDGDTRDTENNTAEEGHLD